MRSETPLPSTQRAIEASIPRYVNPELIFKNEKGTNRRAGAILRALQQSESQQGQPIDQGCDIYRWTYAARSFIKSGTRGTSVCK